MRALRADWWLVPLLLLVALDAAWRWLWRLDTLTGAVTLLAMYLVGQHSAWGWVVGLANQALWIALIQRRKLWGLVPLTCALTVLYSRNLAAWW